MFLEILTALTLYCENGTANEPAFRCCISAGIAVINASTSNPSEYTPADALGQFEATYTGAIN